MKLTANATREIDVYYEIDLTEDELWAVIRETNVDVESLDQLDNYDLREIWDYMMTCSYDINEEFGDGDEQFYDMGIEK